ncbi:glycosylhydrolase family 18-9, partial [Colletotrichum orchidophilum]
CSSTLSNPSCKSTGCGFSAGGNPDRSSASAGTLMFSEIQEIINKGGAQVTTDKTAAVKFVTWGGNQWVSYDDEETLKLKMDYANGKCLGGVMVWAASTDDAKGTAIKALAKASGRTDLSKSLSAKAVNSDPPQCVWGECGVSCPAGLVPVESSGSNASPLGIELGCNQGKRNFCCPSKNPPTCKWKGSPKFCGALAKNRCSGKEIEIAASTDGCWTGHKSLCCTKTDSTNALDSCEWLGAAPFCSAGATIGSIIGLGTTPVAGAYSFLSYGCPNKDKPKELTTGKQGEGGQQTCAYNGGFKSYCCKDPVPWKECKRRSGNTVWVQWKQILSGPLANLFFDFSTDCKTGCDNGEVTVATDGFGCRSGTYAYFCCGNPNTPVEPQLPEISLCPSPAGLPDLSTTPESDSSPKNVFKEGDVFDDNCILPPTNKRRHIIRAARPHQRGFDTNETSSEEAEHPAFAAMDASDLFGRSLEKRGARDIAMKLCVFNEQTSSIYTHNYPGATSVIRSTGKAFTVAKQGVCAAVGIAALNNLDPNTNWVTEHVFEKQEFRDAVEWMMDGNTPKGVALIAGKAPFTGVFDLNGLFQDIWPSKTYTSLVVVRDWAGNINDAFTGLLGRTSDQGLNNANIVNLQVCDADFNRYKEFIVAGSDFMSQATWKNFNPTGRIAILSDVIDTFAYRSETSVVSSYQKTYSALSTLWGDFGRYALSKGVSYDFASAWKEVVPANLESQVSSARTLFESYVKSELAFWKSTAAATTYSPVVVKEMTDKLTDWQGKVTTLISLPINKMTG